LLSRDRQVGTGADPGADGISNAYPLEFLHQAAQPALAAIVGEQAGEGIQKLRMVRQSANDAAKPPPSAVLALAPVTTPRAESKNPMVAPGRW
jgi:hypothetical protein